MSSMNRPSNMSQSKFKEQSPDKKQKKSQSSAIIESDNESSPRRMDSESDGDKKSFKKIDRPSQASSIAESAGGRSNGSKAVKKRFTDDDDD